MIIKNVFCQKLAIDWSHTICYRFPASCHAKSPAMSGWAKYINKLLALTKWPCWSLLSAEILVWKCGYGGTCTYIMKHKVCVFDMLSAILVDCNHLPKSVVLM